MNNANKFSCTSVKPIGANLSWTILFVVLFSSQSQQSSHFLHWALQLLIRTLAHDAGLQLHVCDTWIVGKSKGNGSLIIYLSTCDVKIIIALSPFCDTTSPSKLHVGLTLFIMYETINFEKHKNSNDFLSSKRSKRIIKVYCDQKKCNFFAC